MDEPADERTDRDLVLAFRPEAQVQTRTAPGPHPRTQYRVAYGPVPGARDRRPPAWCDSEDRAWRGACARLGLRIRRTG